MLRTGRVCGAAEHSGTLLRCLGQGPRPDLARTWMAEPAEPMWLHSLFRLHGKTEFGRKRPIYVGCCKRGVSPGNLAVRDTPLFPCRRPRSSHFCPEQEHVQDGSARSCSRLALFAARQAGSRQHWQHGQPASPPSVRTSRRNNSIGRRELLGAWTRAAWRTVQYRYRYHAPARPGFARLHSWASFLFPRIRLAGYGCPLLVRPTRSAGRQPAPPRLHWHFPARVLVGPVLVARVQSREAALPRPALRASAPKLLPRRLGACR